MILHNVRVTHWRGLLNPAEVGPFSDELNVIHAPNGTGKSSLFEAMRRALFDSHHVTGSEIEAVRPWGRSLSPQVVVEFSQAGVRYRIEKTFLAGATARLFRFEAGHFAPLADGRNADSQLREILAVTDVPGRGLSKQEHWGLAQVLWAPQGALSLGSLSPTVSANLRRALGVQLTGEGGSQLEALLEEQYLTLFTKGGKPRTGKDAAPILVLESDLAETIQERQGRLEQQQSFEEAARAVEDARQKRAQSRREAGDLAEPLAQTRSLAESYRRLQGDLQGKRQTEQTAKERFESVGRTIELIGKARQEVLDFKSQIKRDESSLVELAAELVAAKHLADVQRRTRDEARQKRTSLNNLSAEVEDARAFASDIQARQTLAARLEKLQQIHTTLNTEKQSRSALVSPEDKTIREVRKQLTARDKSQTTLQAALIRLTVRPLRAAKVTQESPKETKDIPAENEVTFTGSPEVSINIAGFGRIHAAGPEMDVDALREEAAEANQKLAKLTQPYGSRDPDHLQMLRDQAKELDLKIETLEAQIAGLLTDDKMEDLQAQRAELEARIVERTGRFPAWKNQPPVVSDLQSALEYQRKEVETAVEEAEDAFEKAQTGAQAVEKRHTNVEAALRNARLNLDAANQRLTELTTDGLSDDARQAARQEALMSWEAARSQAKECESKLAEIGEDPQKSADKLERQLAALREAETAARDDENKAEGRLQTLAAEGAYSKLAACEEKLADLNARIRREKLRMGGLRLLHDTVAECKAAAVAAVAAPVERTASRMFARVAGPRLGTVRLTDQFVPSGIQPEMLSAAVELDNLSGGEQEQLFLITRLALGQVLAKDERQLVVLDDVLNATDTGRLARVLTLLEEAADRLQIVILTCHPERYRALEHAKFLGL